MKKLLILASFVEMVKGREEWFQPDPYGMLYMPVGSYHMGANDDEVGTAHTTKSKIVSIQAFYMDETEISNNEYRQFVFWVRDSIGRVLLANGGNAEAADYQIPQEEFLDMAPLYRTDNNLKEFYINWEKKIKWDSPDDDYRTDLQPLYLPEGERYYNRKEIDTRKLNYEYYRIDIRLAAAKSNRFLPQKSPDNATAEWKKAEYMNGVTLNDGGTDKLGTMTSPVQAPGKDAKTLGQYEVEDQVSVNQGNYVPRQRKGVDRSVFIVKDVINCYPDTLA